MSELIEKLKKEFSDYLDRVVAEQPKVGNQITDSVTISQTVDSEYRKSLASNYVVFGLQKHYPLLSKLSGAFLAGGLFKNHFKKQSVRDIDIFFKSQEAFDKAVKFFEAKSGTYAFHYENDNCKAFKSTKTGVVYELVRTRFGTVEDILNVFDFTIVKAALELQSDGKLVFTYHKDFFEHLMTNKLVIVNELPLPVNTLQRTWKYAKYGYGLCRESKAALTKAVIERGDVTGLNRELYFGID